MTATLLNTELEYREGASDKVYNVAIEESGKGFVVNFAYGRRGSTLNTGTKTQSPVSLEEAQAIHDKLVKSKTTKGYKPVNSGTAIGMIATDQEQRDTGLRPQLLNPITEDDASAYLDDDRWCAQEKYDGRRMLIRKSGTDIEAANRNGLSIGFPHIYAEQLRTIPSDFVVDGESVGETFYAFDLLENAEVDLRDTPYRFRLSCLQKLFGKLAGNIVVAETVHGAGKPGFAAAVRAAGKEGVVFKDLDAKWSAGRPASGGSAFKCKFWETCSCVVAKVNAKRSVALALGGEPVGNVTIPANHEIPAVGQVVEIRYLYVTAPGGSLYQPIYMGQRDDIRSEECTVEQQHIKYRPAHDKAA